MRRIVWGSFFYLKRSGGRGQGVAVNWDFVLLLPRHEILFYSPRLLYKVLVAYFNGVVLQFGCLLRLRLVLTHMQIF